MYPQSEFPGPPYPFIEKYAIVRINGELNWVSAEKMNEYNERYEALGGDWSWEQEQELDNLRAQRARVFHPEAERVVQDMLTHLNELNKQDVGGHFRSDGSYPGASYPKGVIQIKPPSTDLDKLKKNRRRSLICLSFLILVAFSNAITMPHAAPWLQWFMVGTWLPAAAFNTYNLERTRGKIKAEEIRSSVTFTPLPSIVTGYVRDKPRSEQYADKYVETGQLMYKYLMEDAYAREHEHDFDIKELP